MADKEKPNHEANHQEGTHRVEQANQNRVGLPRLENAAGEDFIFHLLGETNARIANESDFYRFAVLKDSTPFAVGLVVFASDLVQKERLRIVTDDAFGNLFGADLLHELDLVQGFTG